ncbi:MAG: hypothetical protein ACUVV3_05500 [Dehalococcoidia bacterium]
MANPGAALGQAVGKLIEARITAAIHGVAQPRGYQVAARRLKNGQGNQYQIDCVVSDKKDNPIVIVDPKYIRYKKHNRDKGSWLCTAHYSLRKTFPTLRKSITILSGNWSRPSIALIKSLGIEVHQIPFDALVQALAVYNVPFEWEEDDTATPACGWKRYQELIQSDPGAAGTIADQVTAGVLPDVMTSVEATLDADPAAIERRAREVEILLKTTHDEFLLYSYPSVAAALQHLSRLVTDRPIGQS